VPEFSWVVVCQYQRQVIGSIFFGLQVIGHVEVWQVCNFDFVLMLCYSESVLINSPSTPQSSPHSTPG
jgi:hypothetical protein